MPEGQPDRQMGPGTNTWPPKSFLQIIIAMTFPRKRQGVVILRSSDTDKPLTRLLLSASASRNTQHMDTLACWKGEESSSRLELILSGEILGGKSLNLMCL